jgi:ribosomal protein S17E
LAGEGRKMTLNKKAVKEIAKQYNKRVSKEFLNILDGFVTRKIEIACKTHNGTKKTLDEQVAGFIGLTK